LLDSTDAEIKNLLEASDTVDIELHRLHRVEVHEVEIVKNLFLVEGCSLSKKNYRCDGSANNTSSDHNDNCDPESVVEAVILGSSVASQISGDFGLARNRAVTKLAWVDRIDEILRVCREGSVFSSR